MLHRRYIIFSTIVFMLGLVFVFYSHKTNAATAYDRYYQPNRYEYASYNRNSDSVNVEPWLSFVGILSTLFAVFFVYTGFKIDSTKEKIDDAEKRVVDLERKIQEEIYEYARQLEYCMSFIVQKQYDKAIDALTVLRNEAFVLKDDRKINTCCFFLAHCYYEKGITEVEISKKKENLALAVEYINQAIESSTHPFKNEIINTFNKLDKS